MADLPYDPAEEYQGDASGQLHPALIDFRRQFTSADGAQWGKSVADKIQTYLTTRAIADNARRDGEAFITNVHATQQHLAQMVEGDPHAADLAMDLAGDAAHALASHHPEGPERDGAVEALTSQFRNQIAHAAVRSLAGIDPDAARSAIDKYGDHLTAGEVGPLNSYITSMQRVRLMDTRAAYIANARQMVEQSNGLTGSYLASMMDPQTGQLHYQPDWGSRMMLDDRLAPEGKAALLRAYDAIQVNGDVPVSNPALVTSLLERAALAPHTPEHPMTPEVVSHVGRDLSIADANFINSRIGAQNAPRQNETAALVDALGRARDFIGSGQGSQSAYSRFVNWFLPTYQKYTAAGMSGAELLDPNNSNYLLHDERMQQFKPSGDDIIQPIAKPPEQRRSLGEILAAPFINAAQNYLGNYADALQGRGSAVRRLTTLLPYAGPATGASAAANAVSAVGGRIGAAAGRVESALDAVAPAVQEVVPSMPPTTPNSGLDLDKGA